MAKVAKKAGWNLSHSYARLPEIFFTRIKPIPVRAPKLVIFNRPLAVSLGLDPEVLQGKEGVEIFAGNRLPEGAEPLAQAYSGHQFGYFTLLGDGRAHLLGEQITPDGERYDIQLKGSGRTPYSRSGDGRATLGPMLREYIISEAMHALGIPTTRSLAVVKTGEGVRREKVLPGAVLCRVAASHLRVGTFQYAAVWGDLTELKALADYTLQRHFPEYRNEANCYLQLYKQVIKRQAKLIAHWQLVGFVHGVMNTDNMTISGETIDYGPCAFLDTYNPATVFSSIDEHGRYAYGRQPDIGGWNLARLAEALLPLFHPDQEQAVNLAQEALAAYQPLYQEYWLAGMRAKLGLFNRLEDDETLITELLNLMERYEADYTNTFRALTLGETKSGKLFCTRDFAAWQERWQARLRQQRATKAEVLALMKKSNPAIIPRNHRVEEALAAAVERDDYSILENLLSVLANPYAYTPEQEKYAVPPPPADTPYRTFCGT